MVISLGSSRACRRITKGISKPRFSCVWAQQYGKGHILWGAIFPLRDCPPRHFPVPSRPPPPRPEFPGQVSRPAARPTASSVPGAAVLPQTPTAPTLDKPLLQLSSPRHALHLVARRTRYQGNGVTLARPRADLATLHFSWSKGKAQLEFHHLH